MGEGSSSRGEGSSDVGSKVEGSSGDDSSSNNGSREAAQVDSGSSGSIDDELARTNRTTTRRMHNSFGCCYVPEELRGRT